MNAALEYLPWDSQHFQYKIGRLILSSSEIELAEIEEQARNEGYNLLYLISDEPLDLVAKGEQLLPIDEKLIFKKTVLDETSQQESIEKYTDTHVDEQLRELAYISGHQSRFLLEPHFTTEQFRSMYDQWIERCAKGELADSIIVYRVDGVIAGFVAYGALSQDTCDIKLVAVHPRYQKRAIGSSLLRQTEHECNLRKFLFLQVATQQHNKAGCSLYSKNNFHISTRTYIYHLWI